MSGDEVSGHVLSLDSRPLTEIIHLHRLWWPINLPGMPVHRLPLSALFASSGEGWKKPPLGRAMNWVEEG